MISLRDAEKRRAEISRQLENLGLAFEIVDAVDGRVGLTHEQEKLIDRPGTLARLEREMSDAEYACAISHLQIWQHIVKANLPGAIILEDDAIVDQLFADFLATKSFGASSLILLDHAHARARNWTKPVRALQGTKLIRIVGNSYRTTGYTVSYRGAAYLAAHSLPLQGTADWPCDITPLKPFVALPRLVNGPKDKADSTILPSRNILISEKRMRAKTSSERLFQKFSAKAWRRRFLRWFTYRIS